MKNKKELKAAYKEMKFPMGVFQIKNKINGKILIDSSLNMPAKWNRHHVQLKFGSHRNSILQQEWNQFGADAFEYEVLSEVEFKKETTNYEQEVSILKEMYLEKLLPFGIKGYNKQPKIT